MDIDQLINNVKKIKPLQIIKDSMAATESRLIEAQQLQMLSGKTSEGKLIGKYKNPKYAIKKFNMNSYAGFGNVDLRLSGEFQRNTKVYFFSTAVIFKSTDQKTPKLVDRYGEQIFGLNADNIKFYSFNYLTPEANKRFTNALHGV